MILVDRLEFQKSCEKMFEDFLSSSLVCFDPIQENDENVIAEIERRSHSTFEEGITSYLFQSGLFCSIYEVVHSRNLSDYGYSGIEFELVPIKDICFNNINSCHKLAVKESCFRYEIAPQTEDCQFKLSNKFDDSKQYANQITISTIDDTNTNCGLLIGKQYLLDYYIPGIDRFNKDRKAYRFYSLPAEHLRPDFYREHLLRTRAFVVSYILKHPAISCPIWGPAYIISPDYRCILEDTFNHNYKNRYTEILKKTVLAMNKASIYRFELMQS